ncbi:hypothetical protein BH10PSE18_BH10PSE18_22790 [soil metagenome]
MRGPKHLPRGATHRTVRCAGVLLSALGASLWLHAQPQPPAPGAIYSCTDAQGRTFTADRPLAECLDREQRELGPAGTTRRRVPPSYTPRELAEREENARQAARRVAQQNEERRRERALLVRYPDAAAHDRERVEALSRIDAVLNAAQVRVGELAQERRRIDEELEFYKNDVSKAPVSVRRKLDDNAQSVSVQKRFIGEQETEKKRMNRRFDEERLQLVRLWAGADSGGATAPR